MVTFAKIITWTNVSLVADPVTQLMASAKKTNVALPAQLNSIG